MTVRYAEDVLRGQNSPLNPYIYSYENTHVPVEYKHRGNCSQHFSEKRTFPLSCVAIHGASNTLLSSGREL